MGNYLLIEQNSGFKRKDSTVNQHIQIVHQIYQDINSDKDTCLVFLDVTKAFDKVWHKGLLFKLRQLGIAGTLYDWLEHYLTARSQKGCDKWHILLIKIPPNWRSSGFKFRIITFFDLHK